MGLNQAGTRLQTNKHRREWGKEVKQTIISELDEYNIKTATRSYCPSD